VLSVNPYRSSLGAANPYPGQSLGAFHTGENVIFGLNLAQAIGVGVVIYLLMKK
jgi:hypothetical protein